ncbi:MAG: hypothetical protein M3317_11205 [Actinomycetota bacterium]|nr:hypothetical protein [Actinomycetota bacterium]
MRTMFLERKKPPLVPDPGQRVELLLEDGSHKSGFVAASGPLTSDSGEIVVRVALEEEYRDSKRQRRSTVSMAWPVAKLKVVLPRRHRRLAK